MWSFTSSCEVVVSISSLSICLYVDPVLMAPYLIHYWVVVFQSQNSGYVGHYTLFLFFSLLFSRQMMVLFPPPSPPSKIHPVSLSSEVCSYPLYILLIASSLSLSVQSAVPLQQRLVTWRPSGGSLQLSGWRTTNVLSWFPVQHPVWRFAHPPTCAESGTWLGCGWRGKGYRDPRYGLESLDSLTGVAQLAFLRRRSWTLVDSRGACLSVYPPPPQGDRFRSEERLPSGR